ncbi:MAG: sugar ABC transporter permease [Bacilli bacterium]|jgi:multiple sugar transport system permease protein
MESKNNWKAWLYLAPVIILMAVFTFYPIINTIGISFLKNYDSLMHTNDGFTFDNYLEILMIKPKTEIGVIKVYITDFIQVALPNTLLITFITVPISILLALAIAIALNSVKFMQKIFQTIFFMPYVTNAIAIGMVFSIIFDNNGIINYLFKTNIAWIYAGSSGSNPSYWAALFALCTYIVWHSLPYKILIFLGGLQNIDGQYYDAARVDGSNKFKIIRRITIPLLSPQILYVMITSFIGAFKEYTSVVALFGGTGSLTKTSWGASSMLTVAYYIYNQMSKTNTMQYAAAGAVILFIIILFFTLIQKIVAKKRVHY